MIIKYDETTDSIYFILSNEKPYESEEISNGVVIDYGKNDDIVAIEVLNIPIVGNFLLKQASSTSQPERKRLF